MEENNNNRSSPNRGISLHLADKMEELQAMVENIIGTNWNKSLQVDNLVLFGPPHLEDMKTETAASVKEAPAVSISTPNSATLNLGLELTNLCGQLSMSKDIIMLLLLGSPIKKLTHRTDNCSLPQLDKLFVTGSSFQDSIQLPRRSRNTSKQDLNTKSKHSSRNLDDATKDMMMEKTLRAAGALRGRDVAAKKLQESNREAHLEPREPPRFAFQHHSTLVAATFLVSMSFLAALRPSSELLKVELINSSQTGKRGTPITDLFVLFNSTAFISLIVLIFSITQKLSVQPWFLFVEFSIVGAYVCSVMVVTPHLVPAVLLIGGFILLVACFKFLGFHKMVLKWLQWLCTKVQSERKSTAPDAYLPLVSNIH